MLGMIEEQSSRPLDSCRLLNSRFLLDPRLLLGPGRRPDPRLHLLVSTSSEARQTRGT